MPSKSFGSQQPVLPHLTRGGGGLSGEVADLRNDIDAAFLALEAAGVGGYDIWTNVALSDVDAIKESVDSSDAAVSYTGTDLDGAVGLGEMSPPRNIIITTTSDTDIDAVDVVITGKDVNNNTLTETITLTDNGNATDVGVKAFAYVTQIDVPAQTGTGGSMQFGFGNKLGLSAPLASVAGLSELTKEIVGGVNVSELVVVDWVDLAVADVDAIKTNIASNDSDVTYSGADFNGAIGEGEISPPRNFTITSSAHADVDAVDVVVTGLDIYGNVITDTITMTADIGATDAGTVAFSYITSVFIPAHTGGNSTFQLGFGVVVGLPAPIQYLAGDPQVLSENDAGTPKGVDVLANTYATAATTAPCGTVTNATAPDDGNDYGLVYVAAKGTLVAAATGLPNGTYEPVVAPGGGVDIAVFYPSSEAQ